MAMDLKSNLRSSAALRVVPSAAPDVREASQDDIDGLVRSQDALGILSNGMLSMQRVALAVASGKISALQGNTIAASIDASLQTCLNPKSAG